MAVFEDLFRDSKGMPITYNGETIQMMDEVSIGESAHLRIRFEGAHSEWRQGVALGTEGMFVVGTRKIKRGLLLWQDTSPQEVDLEVFSRSGAVQIKNVWDIGDGVVHSWHNGAAMIVKCLEQGRHYRCNDGHPDDDFDDLVFSLTVLSEMDIKEPFDQGRQDAAR